jgi:K+-sensing histidine kinase KdpD
MAQRIEAELYVLYIDIGTDEDAEDRRSLEQNLRFADNWGAKVCARRRRA